PVPDRYRHRPGSWLAVARDPETYERFDNVVVVHGVRQVQELAYQELFEKELPEHEFWARSSPASCTTTPR
nr:hypothetical protein [Staphylococcus epidermidis]